MCFFSEKTSPQARRAPACPSARPSMKTRQWSTLLFSRTSIAFTVDHRSRYIQLNCENIHIRICSIQSWNHDSPVRVKKQNYVSPTHPPHLVQVRRHLLPHCCAHTKVFPLRKQKKWNATFLKRSHDIGTVRYLSRCKLFENLFSFVNWDRLSKPGLSWKLKDGSNRPSRASEPSLWQLLRWEEMDCRKYELPENFSTQGSKAIGFLSLHLKYLS